MITLPGQPTKANRLLVALSQVLGYYEDPIAGVLPKS